MKRIKKKKKRKLVNWNDLKAFSEIELIGMTKDFQFKTKPWKHQRAAFLACIANPGFLSALDLGTGKTKVAIDVCVNLFGAEGNVLVVALNSAVENWRDEVLMHSDMPASCVRGKNSDERWGKILNSGFSIINYESLRNMLTTKKKNSNGKNKLVFDQKSFKRLLAFKFDVIIYDESHLIKEPKTLNFRVAKKITKEVDTRLMLTGTPFGNTLLDVWAQYYIIDKGETYGLNFSGFKNAYFEDKGYFGPLWEVTKTGKKKIEDKLFTKAIRYREEEVDALPDKVFRVLKFDLNAGQRREYNNLMNKVETEATYGVTSAVNAYRQICSGFILKTKYKFTKNPKMELLVDLLENVIEHHKVVIFYEFTMEWELILAVLKKLKIKYNYLNGSTKNKYDQYNTFQQDDSYRVMVAHPMSGGTSINLTAATYCVFFSNGRSVISKKQCIKRIHRAGQKHRCFFYELIANNTVEVSIKNDLDNGMDAFTNVVDGKTSFKNYMNGEIDGACESEEM